MVDEDSIERSLASFRHEAANPVALIAATLRQLQRHVDDDDAMQLLETAQRQTDLLQRLLDRLRGVRADEVVLEPTRFDLHDLADRVIQDLRLTVLRGRTCDLSPSDRPAVIDGDPDLLRQLLTNLLDNAVKYTPSDSAIHVAVESGPEQVELAVVDEGDGVAPEDLQRIFRRFERADTGHGGLGLGLHIVWQIARAHGGGAEAQPSPSGRGTRFVVRLPSATRR